MEWVDDETDLEISVHNVERMEVGERVDDFRGVELGGVVVEPENQGNQRGSGSRGTGDCWERQKDDAG